MNLKEKYYSIYDRHQLFFLVPLTLIVLAAGVLGASYLKNNEFLDKGTDFAGGTEIQFAVNGSFKPGQVEQLFAEAGYRGVNAVRQNTSKGSSLLVQIPPPKIKTEKAQKIMASNGYDTRVLQSISFSASVSSQFFLQAQIAFLLAFTVMSMVIFVAFKDLTPSLAVIFAAAGDIIIAAGGMAVLGIPLTLGSIAALLMLIGYSVDTDIVLSTRALKNERGSLKSRMWESMATGVTMSAGGIAGFTILFFISQMVVGPSELSNIAAVMVIGLTADLPLTWLGNTAILKSYITDENLLYRWS